jgi:carboxypeptidase family protein
MTLVASRLQSAVLAIVLALMTSSPAFAQGGSTAASLAGTVVDASGGLIPGADVVAQNVATGIKFTAVTGTNGAFNIPVLPGGTYTVTVSLTGFKTVVLEGVTVNAAVPASVRAVLEVGSLEETVVVTGGSEVVQTQSSTISTTITADQVNALPLVSRDAMNFITQLPGVDTATTNRNSSINGLPRGSINITIDGINSQDETIKNTDGFFSIISPRLDAVEEVTVSTAGQGADSNAQGAVQIRFVTRSGTNKMAGSAYYYIRHPALNTNYWFNNRDLPADPKTGKAPKDQVKLYQPGFRIGGPIVIPRLWDGHNKAFYFFNYEEFRLPGQITRMRTILHPRAEQGFFRYTGSSGLQEVNVLDLARANGQTATIDPTVGKLLADIRAATARTGGIADLTDPSLQRYTFTNDNQGNRYYPTWRLDLNMTDRHRLSYSSSYQYEVSEPDTLNNRDPNFPGFPGAGSQISYHYTWSTTLRSTLKQNIVNEARGGFQTTLVYFAKELVPGQYSGTSVGDQGGFLLNLSAFNNLSNATPNPTPSARNAPYYEIADTMTWLKGPHSVSVGGSWVQVNLWSRNQTVVPTVNFGIVTGDPASGMFTPANFPGASTANLTAAQNLYAVLTGRVASTTANARLAEDGRSYVYLGPGVQRIRVRQFDVFAQDAWRVSKTLTANYGVRWAVQMPFTALNSVYSTATIEDAWGVSGVGNLFEPGVLTGTTPSYDQFARGAKPYNIDWNNLAPSVGFAWTPAPASGLLRRVAGREGDTVLRAGFTVAYSRQGMNQFSNVLNGNPGLTISANRNETLGNLGPLPILLSDRSRLGAPAFPESPAYPNSGLVTDSVNVFDPDIQVPYAQSWSAGIQRALDRRTAVEVRYVGTHGLQAWQSVSLNEINVVENGFLDEFRLAQANLQTNIAAGRGATFRYFGPGTGTSPLPIFLAFFSGIPRSQAGDPALYTSALFSNSTYVNPLAITNPVPTGNNSTTNALLNDQARLASAARAGLPANFFVANPDKLGGASITGNGGSTRYDALQIELRRRLHQGFLISSNYTFASARATQRVSFRAPLQPSQPVGNSATVRHGFKVNWVYLLPFGRGHRFGGNANGVLDRLIGDWEIDGTGRVQSGQRLSFGNVRLMGFNDKDLQKMYKIRKDDANRIVYILPQDVIDNTIKAFSTSATSPTGYGSLGPPSGRYFAPANGPDCIQVVAGDCAPLNHFVTGPPFVRFDLSVVKRVPIAGRVKFELRGELLNVLNNVNFFPVATIQQNSLATLGQVTSSYRDTSVFNTIDPGGRLAQIVTRVTW